MKPVNSLFTPRISEVLFIDRLFLRRRRNYNIGLAILSTGRVPLHRGNTEHPQNSLPVLAP